MVLKADGFGPRGTGKFRAGEDLTSVFAGWDSLIMTSDDIRLLPTGPHGKCRKLQVLLF